MQLPINQPNQTQPQALPKRLTKSGEKTHLLFDFDTWTYDIAFAAQTKEGEILPFQYCMDLVDTRFEEICYKLGCETYTGFLTGSGNHRHEIAVTKPYKSGRGDKPYWYKQIREYLIMKYNAVVTEGIEADDAIAMEAHHNRKAIVVSRDKDFDQTQNRVYTYKCGKQEERLRSQRDNLNSLYYLLTQTLTGDTTDTYPGLRGVGPAKAHDILIKGFNMNHGYGMLQATILAFVDKLGPEEGPRMFLEQVRLAFLVREFKDGKPVLPTLSWSFYERYYGNN